MIGIALACILGLAAGFLLLWRIPLCPAVSAGSAPTASVIIPARNEERNLPHLLGSIQDSGILPREVIVVDDASCDGTALVARSAGARVIPSQPLPPGWTGKTWACHQGAAAAADDLLLFLDADTYFEPAGLAKLIASGQTEQHAALSLLPYHVMQRPFEELSLFFNVLMAIGAGGFGAIGNPRLFGQSLLIRRALYQRCGGHAAVRNTILENLAMSSHLEAAGASCVCLGGRGTLNVRMFPDGLAQLCEGWTKAFADGAAAADPVVLGVSIAWLSALCSICISLIYAHGEWRGAFALLYLASVLQVLYFARQVGNYSIVTCLFYPLPLIFYFGVFGQSLYRRAFKRPVQWRGRKI